MGSEPNSGDHHILMLPFMAHGHLIPFLELANFILRRSSDFTVTIANTPTNIKYLRSAVSAATKIHFAELHYSNSDHGLPPNTENTENLPLDKIITLFNSSTALELPLRRLISDLLENDGDRRLCIISDVFLGWSVAVARSFNIPIFSFTTCGAYGTLAYVSVWLNLPHKSTAADEFSVPGFPERCRFHRSQLHRFILAADGTDSWSRFFQPQIASALTADGWLCNTAEGIESFGLKCLRDYTQIPIWAIGPVLPQTGRRWGKEKESGVESESCINWLNSHRKSSVLYISFGSQNTITETQMMELAHGLEESKTAFIWVVRPPTGTDMKAEFRAHEWLPERFEERMKETNRGLLVRNWAPQLEILSHESIGGFLSHCGWNSTVESLRQGVPVIGWPMAAEQAYNSKMVVEEMGIGVELTRGKESEIKRGKVKEVIEMVMGGNGEEMRKKAAIVKEKMKAAMEDDEQKGSSVRNLEDFLEIVRSKSEKKKTWGRVKSIE